MPKVKVGLNQWVVAKKGDAELVTDGLSGCIGVVIWTEEHFCLAHVLSDYGKDNMAAYNNQLSLPVAVMRRGGAIRGCAVVYSDNVDKARAELILAWGKTLKVEPEKPYRASGVRVWYTSSFGPEILEKESDNRDHYQLQKGALTTSTGVKYITSWGKLASNASEAT